MHSPEGVPDLAAITEAREQRRERRERRATRGAGQGGGPAGRERPTIAVIAERPNDDVLPPLGSAGWLVTGVLAADVFDGVLWAARSEGVSRNYVELAELLADPALDAVCLDLPRASAPSALMASLRGGLHVLLPAPIDLSTDVLRAALMEAEDVEVEHAVVFPERRRAAYSAVTALLREGALGNATQVTVRAWPTGPFASADLVDLVVGWLGDVVAVCAAPDELPATRLPGGGTVRWALLTESGCTVLVAHDGADEPLVRLSYPHGRLEVAPDRAVWDDGTPLAVDTAAAGVSDALVAAARHLALVVIEADPPAEAARGDAGAATLRDLYVVARVREALHLSAVEARWVEIG